MSIFEKTIFNKNMQFCESIVNTYAHLVCKIWKESIHYLILYEFLLLVVQNFCPSVYKLLFANEIQIIKFTASFKPIVGPAKYGWQSPT